MLKKNNRIHQASQKVMQQIRRVQEWYHLEQTHLQREQWLVKSELNDNILNNNWDRKLIKIV